MDELPISDSNSSFMVAPYDAATTGFAGISLVLFLIALFYLIKTKLSSGASLLWFLVILMMPVVGSIFFLLYLKLRRS